MMQYRTRRLLAAMGSLAILLLVLIAYGAVRPGHERYLMVHSDDAGFSAGVNAATIRAMEQGVVTSASIMVMLPGFDEIADYAIAHPEKDFGVHLVLTCEKNEFRWGPVLKGEVPSLVEPDGGFWHRADQVAAQASADEVERELRAQVRRALDRGIPISHLDHHMWVLLQRPDLLRIYVQLGVDFRLPLRLHRVFAPEECGKLLQDGDEYRRLIEPVAGRGAPLFDFIETRNYDVPASRKREHYLRTLRGLRPGLSEFVVHCSSSGRGGPIPNAPERREADARVLTSQEMRDEIRRLGIRLVDWKEIRRLREAGRIP